MKLRRILFLMLVQAHFLSAASVEDRMLNLKNLEAIHPSKLIQKRNKRNPKKKPGPSKADYPTNNPNDYPYNPNVDVEVWDKLRPYFLPSHHPIKSVLDEIFQSSRLTLNRETFISAGFQVYPPKQPGNLLVGKHERLNGYLIKAYLDNQDACEWDNYIKRVTGAISIQQGIYKYGYGNLFKVPKKWIYPLPLEHSVLNEEQVFPKSFVLVVEDMNILDHHRNTRAFQRKITPKILDALLTMLTEEGLIDSVFRGNIPFDREGKMCFIDTEHHHLSPINFSHLTRYLSPEMQSYWESITTAINTSP